MSALLERIVVQFRELLYLVVRGRLRGQICGIVVCGYPDSVSRCKMSVRAIIYPFVVSSIAAVVRRLRVVKNE